MVSLSGLACRNPVCNVLQSNGAPSSWTHGTQHKTQNVISASGLGAFLTLSSAKLHLDPAMTSAPLMTTIVDTTGLVIYFMIAQAIISQEELLSALENVGSNVLM